jgi:hypothetical protein
MRSCFADGILLSHKLNVHQDVQIRKNIVNTKQCDRTHNTRNGLAEIP